MAKRKARSHDNTARKKLSHITQQAYQDESTNDFMSISNSFICDASLIRSESASDLVGKRYLETKAAKSGTDETSEVHKRASGRLQRRQREELSSEKKLQRISSGKALFPSLTVVYRSGQESTNRRDFINTKFRTPKQRLLSTSFEWDKRVKKLTKLGVPRTCYCVCRARPRALSLFICNLKTANSVSKLSAWNEVFRQVVATGFPKCFHKLFGQVTDRSGITTFRKERDRWTRCSRNWGFSSSNGLLLYNFLNFHPGSESLTKHRLSRAWTKTGPDTVKKG